MREPLIGEIVRKWIRCMTTMSLHTVHAWIWQCGKPPGFPHCDASSDHQIDLLQRAGTAFFRQVHAAAANSTKFLIVVTLDRERRLGTP